MYEGYNKLEYIKNEEQKNALKGWFCSLQDVNEEILELLNTEIDSKKLSKLNGCGLRGTIKLTKE